MKILISIKTSKDTKLNLNTKSKIMLREALVDIRNSKELVGPFSKIADLKKSLS